MTENDDPQSRESSDEEREARPIARFIHEHPGMAIAGGIALGVLAASFLPKGNRKFVAEKSSALADAVSSAGVMLYREAMDRAEAAGDGIREAAGRIVSAKDGDGGSTGDSAPRKFDLAEILAGLAGHLTGRSRD